MSDYDPRRFQLGLMDPAFEQLEQAQEGIRGDMDFRRRTMREDRISGLGNVQQVIEAGDEAASHLDPNDPDDAPVLERWNQERGRLVEQTGTLPGPDLLETSVGATGSQALSDVRRRSRVAQEEREEEVARLETDLEKELIVERGGQEVRVTNASGEVQRQLQENELTFRAEEGNRDRQFEKAMQQAAQDWEGDENQRDRVLQRALQEAGFDFQGDQNAKDRALREARQALDSDIAQMQNDIEQGRLNIMGQEFAAAQNERAYNRLLNHANRIQGIDDPERRQQEEEAFIENLMRRRGALSKPDIQDLADFVGLPQSVEDRLTDAQADLAAANETYRQAQTEGVEARAEQVTWETWRGRVEFGGEMASGAQEAARNGNVVEVRDAIRRAEVIAADPDYDEVVRESALELVENQDELLEQAQTNFETVQESRALTLEGLRLDVAEGRATTAQAQQDLLSNVVARFDTEEQVGEWLDRTASRDDLETIFGTEDVEEARRKLLLEFRAQKRIEEEGELAQQGEALLSTPDVQNLEDWKRNVIELYTRDGMWGPEGESVITSLANAKARAAELDQRGALMDIQRVAATAANLSAQAGLYDLQGRAELLEAESSEAAALLENLGDITGLLDGPLQAAQTEVEQLCGDMSTTTAECESARASLTNVAGMYTDVIQMTFDAVGFGRDGGGPDEPLMSRREYAQTLNMLALSYSESGLTADEAATQIYRENPTVAKMYPDLFKQKYPSFRFPSDGEGGPERPALSRAEGWIDSVGSGVAGARDPSFYQAPEWGNRDISDRAEDLQNDPAFMRFVETAKQLAVDGNPLTDAEIADAAQRFGFTAQRPPLTLGFGGDPQGRLTREFTEVLNQYVRALPEPEPTEPSRTPGQGGEGGGEGAGTAGTPNLEGALTEEGTASPELMEALLNQETSGGAHRDEEGNLIVSSANAVGAGQILPSTAWKPGGDVEPLIEIDNDQDEAEAESLLNEKRAFEAAGEDDKAREKREELDEFLINPEKNNASVNYMEDISAEDSVRFAEFYLNDLLRQFNGNVELALAAYNDGPGDVRTALREARDKGEPENWKEYLPGGRETRDYIPGVLNRMGQSEPEGGEPQGRRRPRGNAGQQQARRSPRMSELGDLV